MGINYLIKEMLHFFFESVNIKNMYIVNECIFIRHVVDQERVSHNTNRATTVKQKV